MVGVRVAGPNAGHTVYGVCPPGCDSADDGEHLTTGGEVIHPWKLRQIPVAAVTNRSATLVLAAGSEIDPAVLASEIQGLDAAGYAVSTRLKVDRSATIIEPSHIQEEVSGDLVARTGSTAKGIGAARVARLRREAATWQNWLPADPGHLEQFTGISTDTDTATILRNALDSDHHVLIEGTQGYGLGLHGPYYPQSTSSDCRAIDFLAMAGVSPWLVDTHNPDRFEVWVVARTYPIRVAGNSGPMHGETSWEQLGLPPERTTVTRKVRRVGEWDPALIADAVRANGGGGGDGGPHCVRVALTMADYKIPQLQGQTRYADLPKEVRYLLLDLYKQVLASSGAPALLIGTGPATVIDLRIQNGPR